ncbi:Serine/threonine-protein kinase TOR [Capsicum baccatum]|uniref:Serine/threonine-protein kinase TOR n=1 Tax=Capsicum baccatum TaxID=33114 RepID=A0A2G2VCB2_CAPBA|nr:Serine/threonine-protein kinase TOR [Capsicum baccatum]
MVVAKQIVEDIFEAKMKSKSRSSTILRFLSLMLVLMIAFLSFSVTDSPILATPGSIIDLRYSNVSIPSHIPILTFPVLPKANSYFKQFSGEAVSYFSKLINDLGSTGSEELDKKFKPIELEEDEESETEPDEEEFQMDADLDDEQEKHDLVEAEKVSVVPAEGNESDSLERDLGQGLTTSNFEVELAKSQSFIADNALESMIDNPESIVKEISVVAKAQPLEMMESPIIYNEDNDDEAQSIEKKPRKSNRRESLAASEFSMGSPLYGSFTTYVRIPAKHESEEEAWVAALRRSAIQLQQPVPKILMLLIEFLLTYVLEAILSNEVYENMGAFRAIHELIDVTISENASKVAKFSNYICAAFETKRDPEILVLASKVLGHLARSGSAMTANELERQVKVALEWLRGERIEYRRFATVLILKEMAENASTVFNVHVPEFVYAIWVALRDPTLVVQGKSIEALHTCLRVIEKRETRWRVQWYYRKFEAAQDGLGRNAPVHSIHGSLLAVGELLSIHGSLLAVGELLRNTREFMMSRYREVVEIVLRYMEHRDRLVRFSITSLLSRIAHFLLDQFVTNYLMICMNHILHVLKIPVERASGFIALREMGHDLLEFAMESIIVYLVDEDGATRKDAALCCCKLVANSFSTISSTQFSPCRNNRASGKRCHRVVEEVYF